MSNKMNLPLRTWFAIALMISLPVSVLAECRMGVFSGRVCTSETTNNTSQKYYSDKTNNKKFRHTHQRYQVRPVPNFPGFMNTEGRNTFVFDPKQFAWAAYGADGNLVKMGPASGGQSFCPDIGQPCQTPAGDYSVYRKGTSSCKSTKFPINRGGAPMPYCMYFNEGYAIHGSSYVPAYNASHGCIRVLPIDAEWLSKHFVKYGTRVIVLPYQQH